jgi:SAM-dependent methyltransferase
MALMERLALRSLRSRLWSLVDGHDVLEVGIGTGSSMPFYPHDARVTGIDLSDRMLTQARKRAEREGIAARLLEMDAQDLRFPAASFDCAVSSCVFCSVPDPVRGLREVHRVLKPNGTLVMLEHVRGPGLLGPFFDLLNPPVVRVSGANINRRTVENVLRAGFEIESVQARLLGIVKLIVARKSPGGLGQAGQIEQSGLVADDGRATGAV